ncbi:MAG: helix-turn-helix domain-containing protein [Lachnospiraceae bacterium]
MTETKIALSIEEAADYTGIGRNTLRNLVEWKKLPVLRVGRKILLILSRNIANIKVNFVKNLRFLIKKTQLQLNCKPRLKRRP